MAVEFKFWCASSHTHCVFPSYTWSFICFSTGRWDIWGYCWKPMHGFLYVCVCVFIWLWLLVMLCRAMIKSVAWITDVDGVSPSCSVKSFVVVGRQSQGESVLMYKMTHSELRHSCWSCPSPGASVCVEIFWSQKKKKKKSVSVPYVYTGRGPVSSPALHIFPLCNRKQTCLSLVGLSLSNITNSERCDLARLKCDVEVSPRVSALWAAEARAHGRRFVAGKHVSVILTLRSTPTVCTACVFAVYTKHTQKMAVSFPRLSLLLLNKRKSTKMLLVWPPVAGPCCREHHRTKDWSPRDIPPLFGLSLIVGWYTAAFGSSKSFKIQIFHKSCNYYFFLSLLF